jgi:hypothetical protein
MTLRPEERQQLIDHSREKASNTEQEIPLLIKNQQLFTAVEKRLKGDYDVLTTFSEQEVRDLFEKMQRTLRAIEHLLS